MEAVSYSWGRLKHAIPAQVVGETVQRIQNEDGCCPPGRLVKEAQPKNSPLHKLFTWDNRAAADQWRRYEARNIINCLVITVQHNDVDVIVPAFLSSGYTVATQEKGEGYRSFPSVAEDPDLSREAMEALMGRLTTLRQRFADLEPFLGVWGAIDDLEAVLAKRLDKAA